MALGHNYLIAAYWCTWIIQLGYLASVAIRWQSQRKRLKALGNEAKHGSGR
jgi:hypothetical protein